MTAPAIHRRVWLAASACLLAASVQIPRRATGQAPTHLPSKAVLSSPKASRSRRLSNQISAILASPAVARDHWGIEVTTLDGTVLYSLNEAQLFQPASNAKLFTTAAALALLGPNAAVTTTVGIHGVFTGKEYVKGNVYIYGAGDANLSGRAIPYASNADDALNPLRTLDEFAAELAQKGLKTVDGDVLGVGQGADQPYPMGWNLDDLVWGYAAPVSLLSVNDNQLKLTVAPAAEVSSHAIITIAPDVPYYTIVNQVRTVDANEPPSIQAERRPGSKELRVYGRIGLKAAPHTEHISIDDPQEYAAIALKQLLERHGVTVTGRGLADRAQVNDPRSFREISRQPYDLSLFFNRGTGVGSSDGCGTACDPANPPRSLELPEHTSPALADDIVLTNKESLNLHAELLLRRLGIHVNFDPGSNITAEGERVVRQFLINAGIDANDFIFFDGSGLSTQDLVTTRATVKLLQYAATQPWGPQWKASLPIGGVDGTLASRFTEPPLKAHVFAKTGTLGEARALSGYLDAASGRTIIFSILVDNHLPGTTDDRDAMDKIVAAIQSAE